MENNNLEKIIDIHYSKLSRMQRRIADFLLNSSDIPLDMTGKHLSKMLNISESTVVRFAQTIGLTGYPELVLLINEYIKSTRTSIERLSLNNEERKVDGNLIAIDEEIAALRKVREHITNEEINNVSNELNNANRIFILGCRTSHYLASYFNFYLSLIKKNVFLLGEKETTIIEELVDIEENDIVFTISFPRYTRALNDIFKYVSSKGAKLILLTDSENNPLVKFSDINLIVQNNILFFVDSLVVPMAVINSIIIDLSLKNKQKTINSLTNMELIWKTYYIFESSKENE